MHLRLYIWPVSLLPFTSLTPITEKRLRTKIYALSLVYSFNFTQCDKISAILTQNYVIRIMTSYEFRLSLQCRVQCRLYVDVSFDRYVIGLLVLLLFLKCYYLYSLLLVSMKVKHNNVLLNLITGCLYWLTACFGQLYDHHQVYKS